MSSNSSNGSESIDPATGAWSYEPNTNFNGSDTFTITITDDASNTATQVINITVIPVDDISVISGIFIGNVFEDGILSVSESLLISDIDISDNPSFNDVTNATGDSGYRIFELVNNTWTYALNNDNSEVQV